MKDLYSDIVDNLEHIRKKLKDCGRLRMRSKVVQDRLKEILLWIDLYEEIYDRNRRNKIQNRVSE